jgi:hypothetical protein
MCDLAGDPDLVVVPPKCVVCTAEVEELRAQLTFEKARADENAAVIAASWTDITNLEENLTAEKARSSDLDARLWDRCRDLTRVGHENVRNHHKAERLSVTVVEMTHIIGKLLARHVTMDGAQKVCLQCGEQVGPGQRAESIVHTAECPVTEARTLLARPEVAAEWGRWVPMAKYIALEKYNRDVDELSTALAAAHTREAVANEAVRSLERRQASVPGGWLWRAMEEVVAASKALLPAIHQRPGPAYHGGIVASLGIDGLNYLDRFAAALVSLDAERDKWAQGADRDAEPEGVDAAISVGLMRADRDAAVAHAKELTRKLDELVPRVQGLGMERDALEVQLAKERSEHRATLARAERAEAVNAENARDAEEVTRDVIERMEKDRVEIESLRAKVAAMEAMVGEVLGATRRYQNSLLPPTFFTDMGLAVGPPDIGPTIDHAHKASGVEVTAAASDPDVKLTTHGVKEVE